MPDELWDITDKPDFENIQRIINYMSKMESVPGAAIDAIEGLLKIAYPGELTAYTCVICGDLVQVPKVAGKRPSKFCKKSDCQKEATRRRVAKHRGKA